MKMVNVAANVKVNGLSPKMAAKITAIAAPIADAGKRINPFLMESEAVGSNVTSVVSQLQQINLMLVMTEKHY